ncbi:hypothetical protein J2X56_001127 [Herbaspirillum sp. 1173]|uniref:hypothetical protein n=1 Tax=Herbaspirillum sp. 1173 TaxID=2817734 RepID=UPI00286415EB|nr:hypothetical protein [Herbaspirillum sp. 1173]MDR6739141.1 hypothetical protein [Herbaspirillum sp. 1173]
MHAHSLLQQLQQGNSRYRAALPAVWGASSYLSHRAPTGSPWLGITRVVLAIVAAISAIQIDTFNSDQIVGPGGVFASAFAAGTFNLQQKKPGKGMSTAAISMAVVSFLVLIGS